MTYRHILLLALAGACGTLARYWLSHGMHLVLGRSFPYGTFAVNVLGCLIFGMLWAAAESRNFIGQEFKVIILVGFAGSFTTFSTFIFENSELLRTEQWLALAVNVLGQCLVGLTALWAGIMVVRNM